MMMRKFILRWFPAGLMMISIFLFSSIPSKEMPNFGGWDTIFKKGGHMLGYAFLAAACWRGMDGKSHRANLISWLIVLGYAFTDEFHQGYVPGRHASAADVLIDGLGGGVGIFVISKYPIIQQFLRHKVV